MRLGWGRYIDDPEGPTHRTVFFTRKGTRESPAIGIPLSMAVMLSGVLGCIGVAGIITWLSGS